MGVRLPSRRGRALRVRCVGICWQRRGALNGRRRSTHWSLDGGASRSFPHALFADTNVWPYLSEHGDSFAVVQLVR
jgi:transcriptional regulator GlxA family with amidase domain